MSGPASLFITIAGLRIEVIGASSVAELGLERRLGPFVGDSGRAVARLTLRWEESKEAPVPAGELLYDPGAIWQMYRAGDAYYAAINYEALTRTYEADGVLQANSGWDQLVLTERRNGDEWHSLLGVGAGELITRTAILFSGGLIMHASGLDDDGRGLVFVGHSGAGKSTQTSLWCQEPGVIAMNDDRVAVRLHEGEAWCYGTPWGGSANIARNHEVPLSALIILEQAPDNELQALSPATAAPLLLARSFLPYWDRALMGRAVANLSALLDEVPVYRLRCRPEPSVIPLVRSAL